MDVNKFASGAVVEDSKDIREIVIDGTVEELCPAAAYQFNSEYRYGKITHETYLSNTCGMSRGVSVVLPANYSTDKSYAVLYMLHGIFGDEYSFVNDTNNKINEIVTNMTSQGYLGEIIVVYPNIYATTDAKMAPGFNAEAVAAYDNFANELVNDLMPYIASRYSVKRGRENTYLAGFSMGGRETMYITLLYPELFGYVCAIAPAPGLVPGRDWAMEHVGSMSEDELRFEDDVVQPDVFILCCGDSDKTVGKFPSSYHAIMERNGVRHIWYEIPGADHDNNAIRSGIYNLLKQIAYHRL